MPYKEGLCQLQSQRCLRQKGTEQKGDAQKSENRGRVCSGCTKAVEEPLGWLRGCWAQPPEPISKDAVLLFTGPKAVPKH